MASAAYAATGTLLENGTLYPRLVRLEHGPPAENGTIIASTNGNIFRSTDDGATFSFVGTGSVIDGSLEYCCATLYEMPQQVGKLHAGTLVFAATYYIGGSRAIEVYTSTDEGKHWRYSATPVSGGDPTHGLWEPQFTVATDGALVMFWSDETDPCCSQKLAQSRSYDGEKWQDQSNAVASLIQADRPGMAVVTQLPSGLYFMSYELCGPAS